MVKTTTRIVAGNHFDVTEFAERPGFHWPGICRRRDESLSARAYS
jgi:hypothetical protein